MARPRPQPRRFRKLLVALIVLVTLPSLAISSFGIMAIVDAREVAEARLKHSIGAKLRLVAHDLGVRMANEVLPEGNAHGDESRSETALRAATLLPILAQRHLGADSIRVELVDDVQELTLDNWTGERVKQAFKDWLDGKTEIGLSRPRDVMAEVRLPPPLAAYRLQAKLAGADMVAAQARANAAFYGIVLGMFYLLLILGVLLISINMYREVQLGKLKTDFVSHVSHELRTPLSSIRMFLETLLMGRVRSAEEQRECLEMCARETERLSMMIERVLDWARMEAGRRLYQKRSITVQELVNRSLTAFSTQRLEAPFTLSSEIRGGSTVLLVDADAITDALLNILHNAFKYTGNDKRIDVRAVGDTRQVHIHITDNGIGISNHEHDKIFEHFYRAEDLLNQQPHGSGLGLALAKRIVEAHGGRILVRSTRGKGSTFTVRIPVPSARQVRAAIRAEQRTATAEGQDKVAA